MAVERAAVGIAQYRQSVAFYIVQSEHRTIDKLILCSV